MVLASLPCSKDFGIKLIETYQCPSFLCFSNSNQSRQYDLVLILVCRYRRTYSQSYTHLKTSTVTVQSLEWWRPKHVTFPLETSWRPKSFLSFGLINPLKQKKTKNVSKTMVLQWKKKTTCFFSRVGVNGIYSHVLLHAWPGPPALLC